MKYSIIATILFLVTCACGVAQTDLKYVPAPPDNPLKGLVPYAGDKRAMFPHSMEFSYLPLSDLMKGPKQFDWAPLEKLLNEIADRGHQTVFRIWMEYPGHSEGIPGFLEQNGLQVTEWMNTNTAPFPQQKVRTPNYENAQLRKALQTFIVEFGKRYDGDPRIGFITAGLLGTWGEWHTYPRTDLMPPKAVQIEVMDAYQAAFTRTPILLRYPAGVDNFHYAANHDRPFGYHDDSFAWATLDTGRKQDNWYFVPAMIAAGKEAANKWKTRPIGGEIRPEIWGKVFDDELDHPQAQKFSDCVLQTHATWLLDSGMFEKKQSPQRIRKAVREVQRMGYEFHVRRVSVQSNSSAYTATVVIQNSGVAPFYHEWEIQFGAVGGDGQVRQIGTTSHDIRKLLPGSEEIWAFTAQRLDLPKGVKALAIRVKNPLKNGLPVRFANEEELRLGNGWLRICRIDQ